MSELDSRLAALYVLKRYRKQSSWSKDSLRIAQDNYKLDTRDTALADRISRCVLEHYQLLDYYISFFSDIPLNEIQEDVLDVLRIGLCQKLYFDRIPDSAIVDTSVSCCRKIGHSRACGFVNAILRKFINHADSLPELSKDDPIKYYAIRYGHSEWIVKTLIDSYGVEHTLSFLESNNREEPRYIYVNRLKISEEDYLDLLDANNISYEIYHDLGNAIQLTSQGRMEDVPGYSEGLFYVQDPAAHQVARISGIASGMTMYDCCGAPGGKSIACAIEMNNDGSILLSDIHNNKLKRVKDNADRLGISILSMVAKDAREPIDQYFDVVVADVPCSGLGVIRNKPEIRYKDQASVSRLPEIQFDIIDNVGKNVKDGGTLIYSTCTVLPAENEKVIDRFLSTHNEYVLDPFVCFGEEFNGMATFWPQIHHTDGFFICKLKKIKK